MFPSSRKWKVIVISCLFFSAVFAIFGGLSFGYSIKSEMGLVLAGTTIGLIAAPEIAPKYFKYPVLWQVAFSTIGLVILAYGLSAPPAGYALAVVAGCVLGWLAPYWIKHINAP